MPSSFLFPRKCCDSGSGAGRGGTQPQSLSWSALLTTVLCKCWNMALLYFQLWEVGILLRSVSLIHIHNIQIYNVILLAVPYLWEVLMGVSLCDNIKQNANPLPQTTVKSFSYIIDTSIFFHYTRFSMHLLHHCTAIDDFFQSLLLSIQISPISRSYCMDFTVDSKGKTQEHNDSIKLFRPS